MFDNIHGRKCVLVNGRWFAVDKTLDRAARIACNTGSTGGVFERIQHSARNNSNKHVFKR